MIHAIRRLAVVSATSVALIGTASIADAQLVPGTPYQRSRGPNTYVELPSPTVLSTNVDDGQFPVTLPFPVRVYSQSETSVSVGANGALAFPSGTSVSLGNTAPGTTGSPSGFVAPLWDDLLLSGGANALIGWQVQGTAPTRTVTFEWRNIGFFSSGGTFSMQVRFYEGQSGRIDIDYGTIAGAGAFSATMGMEDQMNMRPVLFAVSQCTTNCSSADFVPNTRVSVVQDPGVELAAVAVEAPQLGFLGAQTLIPVSVQNLHGNPIGPFTVEVSANQTPDFVGAVAIGTAQMSLAAFESRTINVLTVPPISLGQGNVYLGLTVDSTNMINEVDETNNTVVSVGQLRLVQGLADVAVQRVRTSISNVTAGQTVDVYTRVQNVGGEPANNVDVAVMLSTNPVISPQDVQLDTFTVSLAPGQVMNATTSVTIDPATASGVYFLGGLADPANTLEELSEANNGRADDNPFTVTGGALAILTNRLPTAYLGVTYAARVIAGGGDQADQVWEVSQGQLPMGMGITPATGEIFGRPTLAGSETFTIRLTSNQETATKQLTLTVSDPDEPLTIVTRGISRGVVGQEYAFPIVATGGAMTSSLSWSATNLPPGFAVNNQGVLGGTADQASSSTVTVTVSNGVDNATRDLLLEIRDNANLLIVPRVLSTAMFNVQYAEQLEATGGNAPIIWVVDSGELPPGISLNTSGALSGTPQSSGSYRFVVEARDATPGSPARDSNTFEIIVADDGGLTIATAGIPDAIVLAGYEATLEATGGLPAYSWSIAEGRIPDGLVANENLQDGTFQIRGQPSELGTTNFLVEVTDTQGRSAVKAFSLRVIAAPPVVTPPEEGGCSCTAERQGRTGFAWLSLFVVGLLLVRRRR